ncbi:MAG: TonB-dependent receptor [Saprospiraceae bacterium]
MSYKTALCIFVLSWSLDSQAQFDTLNLKEITVTSTKSERSLSSIPMPFLLIPAQSIQAISAIRLQDILTEQVGLAIVPQVNGLGNGIQIQGLNPDYALILIDGEPIIGRYTGTLELNRFTTGNIRKIEIVKGPASSLYGSEALAGVVNIITDQGMLNKFNISSRLSSRNTWDNNLFGGIAKKKWNASAYINRFSTNGYDLSPEIYGQTVSPYSNYTINTKFQFNPSSNQEIKLSFRYFTEQQKNQYQIVSNVDSIRVEGSGQIIDWNFNPSYRYIFNSRFNLTTRCYVSKYQTSTKLHLQENNEIFYQDSFEQEFIRPEILSAFALNEKNKILFGIGYIAESVLSSRYGDRNKRDQYTKYGFIQHEFMPSARWNTVFGVRVDKNSTYATQFSPKLAAQYSINKNHSIKLSIGTGFKSPDFRQLYLNFINDAASYSVYGTEIVNAELKKLQSQGLLGAVYINLDEKNTIDAETSIAFNLGSNHRLSDYFHLDLNIFRNDLKGLIETQIVATTTSQKNIYSYTNLDRVFTSGLESNLHYKVNSMLDFSIGYQYLLAKDKDVIDQIKQGKIYGRDPVSLESYQIKKNNYFGLANRSRNQINFKINYHIPIIHVDAHCRFLYKGKFGLFNTSGNVSGVLVPPSDINSNGILDTYDSFVKGYLISNLTLGKKITKNLETQIGIENIANYRDPVHIPNLIGRNLFISLQYNFIKS